MFVIRQALHYGAMLRQEELYQQERPIARLGQIYISGHQKPNQQTPTLDEFCFYKPTQKLEITHFTANTIYSLMKESRIPDWVFVRLEYKKIMPYRKGKKINIPRLWVSLTHENIALFCPGTPDADNNIISDIGFFLDDVKGRQTLIDVDTKQVFMIDIPEMKEVDNCLFNVKVKLID